MLSIVCVRAPHHSGPKFSLEPCAIRYGCTVHASSSLPLATTPMSGSTPIPLREHVIRRWPMKETQDDESLTRRYRRRAVFVVPRYVRYCSDLCINKNANPNSPNRCCLLWRLYLGHSGITKRMQVASSWVCVVSTIPKQWVSWILWSSLSWPVFQV